MKFLFMLLAWGNSAAALNPTLDVSQYSHKAWKINEGFTKSAITAIAQTPDGYLWLGTQFGLLRFDGVRNVEWTPPAEQKLPSNTIRHLLVTRDGTLWIGTFRGLASWKDGRFTVYSELGGLLVQGLFEDHEGTVWAGGIGPLTGKLCAIRKNGIQCYGEDGSLGRGVGALYESKGALWAGTISGLWRWKPAPPKFYPVPAPDSIEDLIEGDNGTLWITGKTGISQLKDDKIAAYSLPVNGQFRSRRLLRDREGGLWIGTSGQGLLHLHQGRADVFASADGLSGDQVNALFEDREGNVWAATTDGLDRFRELAIPTTSVKQGLSIGLVGSVLAARDGSVWLGTTDGLNRWDNGQITLYRKRGGGSLARLIPLPWVHEKYDGGLPHNSVQSLFQDNRGIIWVPTSDGLAYLQDDRFSTVAGLPSAVYGIAEDRTGSLWLGDQLRGLVHLRDRRLVEQIPWKKLGHNDYVDALLADRVQGGLWLGFLDGGVAYFKDGQIRASYSTANGLGQGRVYDLRFDGDGALWAATEGGLSRFKNGRIATLTRKNGLPCDAVHATIEDDDNSAWLLLACGMVRIARAELEEWSADSNRPVHPTVFDSSDGVRNRAIVPTPNPHATKSADGKLWFVTEGGVSVIDPRRLPFNKLPPPVQIQQITADRKTYDAAAGQHIPPLVRDLTIDYTALSFVAPEKNRFRYKLEGYDPDWQDVGTRRQAFYTNPGPRHYRFRVQASNNDGVWNEAGAALDFSIDPAWYQTRLFLISCLAAGLAMLWGLYRLRLLQLSRRFDMRVEERVGERTRIARDLHDTLLQSFQGVLLKFSAVGYKLPEESEARADLEVAIDQARDAITEGRDAVQGLRQSTLISNDLARSIGAIGEELAREQTGPRRSGFRIHVEGASRDLPPLVRDEVYRIAVEALRNAFRHADAAEIEVEIRYDPRRFAIRVRDDGRGIDQPVLERGKREGHHGLPGMHERAKLAGGSLAVWSRPGGGTEIELTIAAGIAYRKVTLAGRGAA